MYTNLGTAVMPYIALVDCNNFFCSCERVFQPELMHRPVAVLSNNDGCIIARSNEVKALGIPMGAPLFKVRDIVRKHNIHVCSSNFVLYGDMSERVMMLLKNFAPNIEIYSIDEAFIDLSDIPVDKIESECRKLCQWVEQCTGIPISIGIGQSKTLAKMASSIAKKRLRQPVFMIKDAKQSKVLLESFPVQDIWGVGGALTKRLHGLGVHNAQQLADYPQGSLQRHFSVVVVRTSLELQGKHILKLETNREPKKQIICSRSFGELQTEAGATFAAVAAHTARAGVKLRSQGSKTQSITVFIRTSPFNQRPFYGGHYTVRLATPTSDTRVLLQAAQSGFNEIFRDGYHYKKAGVILNEITGTQNLDAYSPLDSSKQDKLMQTIDFINDKFGRDSVYIAAEATKTEWKMKRESVSAAFTTVIRELPKVK